MAGVYFGIGGGAGGKLIFYCLDFGFKTGNFGLGVLDFFTGATHDFIMLALFGKTAAGLGIRL